MRSLVVVYDRGSADPRDLVSALTPLGRIVFVVADTEHGRAAMPTLRSAGTVVRLDDDADRTVRFVQGLRPDGIVTFSEDMIRRAASIASELDLVYHSPDVAHAITDKLEQRRRLGQLECLAWQEIGALRRAIEQIGLPAVVKPQSGKGSENTYRLQTWAQVEAVGARLAGQPCVAEPLLIGRVGDRFADYVSVESAMLDGEIQHLAVTGKFPLAEPFRETGQLWPAELDKADLSAVRSAVETAVASVGVHSGLTHTEVKLTPRGPRVIEVNGRLGGNLFDLGTRCGVDLIGLAGRIALGKRVAVAPIRPEHVLYQYMNPAPATSGRLVRIDGVQDVLAIPGVTRYRPMIGVNGRIPGGVVTAPLDIVYGSTADHAELERLLPRLRAALRYEFAIDGNCVVYSGEELMRGAVR